MDELISIVVPVYNVENYLKKCVNSILNQTYAYIEIILVDDGSSDQSGIICDCFADEHENIRVIHQKNGGLSSARNAGIDVARGKYISFIDSDDYIDSDFIEKLYIACKVNNKDIAIAPRIVESDMDSTYEYLQKEEFIYEAEDALRELMNLKKFNMAAWDKLYKTSLFAEIRYPEGMVHEDVLTTPQVFEKSNGIVKINDTFYHYIVRGDSISNSRYNSHTYDMYLNGRECYTYFSSLHPKLDAYVFKYYFIMIYTCMKKLLMASDKEDYFQQYNTLLKALRKDLVQIILNKNISFCNKVYTLAICLKIVK